MRNKLRTLAAPLAMAVATTPALAAEPVGRASPTVEDLKVEINQLTAEVEELKKGDSPFTVNGYYRLQATTTLTHREIRPTITVLLLLTSACVQRSPATSTIT